MTAESSRTDKMKPTAGVISLRDVAATDLPLFFEHQLDPDANRMAAFTKKNPEDRQAFNAHWAKIMADDSVTIKTILCDEKVAGSILSHSAFGEPEVSYWVGKEYWGRGIATRALELFLDLLQTRPLFARAAKDNIASIRVLEKCGFSITAVEKGFANARGEEIEEVVMKLD